MLKAGVEVGKVLGLPISDIEDIAKNEVEKIQDLIEVFEDSGVSRHHSQRSGGTSLTKTWKRIKECTRTVALKCAN